MEVSINRVRAAISEIFEGKDFYPTSVEFIRDSGIRYTAGDGKDIAGFICNSEYVNGYLSSFSPIERIRYLRYDKGEDMSKDIISLSSEIGGCRYE